MRTTTVLTAASLLIATEASSFCGFYVAKADATLFNDRSEIILVRDGERTVITMSNDFKGEVRDFAMVIPVPVVLERDDIKVVDRSIFQKLDGYSSPRLVEYYDENPCMQYVMNEMLDSAPRMDRELMSANVGMVAKAKDYGVTIEAQYTIGEYDILILSATESNGLKQWLLDNDYKIPATAHEVLDPYIKGNLKFFVVKVNLDEMQAAGFDYLRPIQIRFESPKFMLPIRLGMANSSGVQDMIVYAFTRTGRVECVNYRTVKAPTDRNIPLFVKDRFGAFYKDLFKRAYRREGRNAVFLEYAWNVTPSWGGMKCDPCVGPPPIDGDLAVAGVNWSNWNGGSNVFFTRLHVRYSRDKFPQDLQFQVTPNTEQYQARYVMTHPAQGDLSCSEGQNYLQNLYYRRTREMDELAMLTGWDTSIFQSYVNEIRHQLPEEKRNSLKPFMPWMDAPRGGGPGFWPMIGFVLAFTLVGLYFAAPRPSLARR